MTILFTELNMRTVGVLLILATFVVNDVFCAAFDERKVQKARERTVDDLGYDPGKQIPIDIGNTRPISGIRKPEVVLLKEQHHLFVGDQNNAVVLQVAQKKNDGIHRNPYKIGELLGYIYEKIQWPDLPPRRGFTYEIFNYKKPETSLTKDGNALRSRRTNVPIRKARLVFTRKTDKADAKLEQEKKK
ncbi:unnamed protein product [Caenorhabditis angaria]|uniref:Uncharacterized protein n=1 Tax=Caenorhabditis angaria TaxID=860376 RepID=A0A9P1ICZ9_9PELO|nr:unnamed protein product [Caenorhabditis angaria]